MVSLVFFIPEFSSFRWISAVGFAQSRITIIDMTRRYELQEVTLWRLKMKIILFKTIFPFSTFSSQLQNRLRLVITMNNHWEMRVSFPPIFFWNANNESHWHQQIKHSDMTLTPVSIVLLTGAVVKGLSQSILSYCPIWYYLISYDLLCYDLLCY
jgi:hypothetical protein